MMVHGDRLVNFKVDVPSVCEVYKIFFLSVKRWTYLIILCMFRILDLLEPLEDSEEDTGIFMRVIEPQLFESYGERRCIHFPLPDSTSLSEQVHCDRAAILRKKHCRVLIFLIWFGQIQRFLLLLTVKDSAMDIPENLDARRRISFFATSLFMDMPDAPKVRNMMSFRSLPSQLNFLKNNI